MTREPSQKTPTRSTPFETPKSASASPVTSKYPDDDYTLAFQDYFSLEEAEMISEICRAGGHGTFASAVRVALYKYAVFLELDPHPDVFALHDGRKRR